MKKQELAYCGLDCDSCPAFIATKNNDNILRQKTAEKWTQEYGKYLGGRVLTPEDINCRGCRSKTKVLFVGCSICPIRKCAKEKGVKSCVFCRDFDKCEMINGFFSCHEQAKQNLRALQVRICKGS
jgi:hypothetical protein